MQLTSFTTVKFIIIVLHLQLMEPISYGTVFPERRKR